MNIRAFLLKKMSSPGLETAQGGNPSDCIAELSLRLANAVKESRLSKRSLDKPHFYQLRSDHALFVFSTPLLKALLTESPVPSSQDRFISFVNQHKDTVTHALETTSLRGLAQFFLRSDSDDGFEMGLLLLMDEPRTFLDTVSMGIGANKPKMDGILKQAQEHLVLRAYRLFLNDMSHARLRRMAGKVLAELLYDSQGNCEYIRESGDLSSLSFLIDTLTSSDIVLSFFASAIIRKLYQSIPDKALSRELGSSYSRIMKHLQSEEGIIENYYSYVRAERQSPSGNVAAVPVYCLLELYGNSESGLPQGLVLVKMDKGRLDFLHWNEDVTGHILTYMILRLTRKSKVWCSISSGKTLLIGLHIDSEDSLTLNDRRQCLQVMTFSIATEVDLANLRRGLKATGIRYQRHCPRRSSSLMIPLDDVDEIDNVDRIFSQTSNLSSGKIMMDQATYGDLSRSESSCHVAPLDHTSETTDENVSESPLTELTRTPDYCLTSSSKKRKSFEHSGARIGKLAMPLKGVRKAENPHLDDEKSMEDATERSKGQEIVSEPAYNTRSKRSQGRRNLSISTGSSILRSNTQESLIFPAQRSKGKLYTALSKTVLGRNDDSKASESSVEKRRHMDPELTSVPSPSPGPTGLSVQQRTRKRNASRTNRSTVKPRPKSKRQSQGGKKRERKALPNGKPDSHAPSSTADGIEYDKPQDGQHTSVLPDASEQNIAMYGANIDSSPLPEMSETLKDSIDARTLPRHTRRKVFDVPTFREQGGPNTMAVGRSRSIPKPEASRTSSTSTSTNFSNEQPQSSGQTVAERLISVLEESGILLEHLDESQETEETQTGPHDMLSPRGLHSDGHGPYEGKMQDSLKSRTAGRSPQRSGSITNRPRSTVSFSGTHNGTLQASTEKVPSNRNARKRASIFGKENPIEGKRVRKTSSLLTSSSTEPHSTQLSFKHCHTSSRTGHQDNVGTSRVFDEITGNTVPCSAATHLPHGISEEVLGSISVEESRNSSYAAERRLQSSKQKGQDRTSGSNELGPKVIIDRNGSPRRSQRKCEQSSVQQGEPSPMETIHKLTANTNAKENSHLCAENSHQQATLQGSSADKSHLRRVASDSKQVFELTANAAHRQTLLQELHKEIERTLLDTDEQLHHHIEAERLAVNEILDEYRNTLHRVIEAQTERINLCQEQRASIMQDYSVVCPNLNSPLHESLGNAV
ncbi:hypothetical protein BJX64DRAFT_261794 [Aspergillus heterothallicus]